MVATAEDNNMEQTETKKQNQLQDVKPSYKEFRGVLDEIDSNIQPGTAGNGMNSIKTATHLLNWGVGTSMTTDEIKKRQYHGFLIKETLNRWNFRISLHLCMMYIRNY